MFSIKNDLIQNNKEYTADIKYHKWLNENKKYILPSLNYETLYEDDIDINLFKYLKCMIYMAKYLESKDVSLFQFFPLRTEITDK